MVLKDAAGAVVDVEQGEAAFRAAMAAPEPGGPATPDVPPPPPVDPEAPYGRRADGTPKKGPGGRPAKSAPKDADKPRVTDQPSTAAAAGGPARDYTKDLCDLADLAHTLMLITPRTHAHAALWRGTTPGMAAAWNNAAQANPQVRRGVEALADSGAAWVAGIVIATMPFAQGAWYLWRNPDGDTAQQLAATTRAHIEQIAKQQQEAMLAAAGVAA